MKTEALKVLIQKSLPQLNEVYSSNEPIQSPGKNPFPVVNQLPGPGFKISPKTVSSIEFDSEGKMLLSNGDYTIPVMTYCMKSSGRSPDAHIYSLSQLKGKRASIIRSINANALLKFSPKDIQILSWSLQAGLKYEELTAESKKIINEIVPRFQPELKESLITTVANKWDQISNTTYGLLPSFDQSSESLIAEFGELGQQINAIRHFKNKIEKVGNNFESLSQLIEVNEQSKANRKFNLNTSWSQINDRVYARFITEGHYQDIGYAQIRVLSDSQKRAVNSKNENKAIIDIMSWLANPNDPNIQPLSFSTLYGYGGVAVVPALIEAPLAAVILLAAVLSAKIIDWDKFFELKDVLKNSSDAEVQKALDEGTRVLNKAHDELEKPARDAGIITGKSKNTSKDKNKETREYTKPGGNEELKKDFGRIPGETSKASDGTEIKTLPDGTRVVHRPQTDNKVPTLEIQPSKNGSISPKTRIKIRYPHE